MSELRPLSRGRWPFLSLSAGVAIVVVAAWLTLNRPKEPTDSGAAPIAAFKVAEAATLHSEEPTSRIVAKAFSPADEASEPEAARGADVIPAASRPKVDSKDAAHQRLLKSYGLSDAECEQLARALKHPKSAEIARAAMLNFFKDANSLSARVNTVRREGGLRRFQDNREQFAPVEAAQVPIVRASMVHPCQVFTSDGVFLIETADIADAPYLKSLNEADDALGRRVHEFRFQGLPAINALIRD